MSHDQDLSSDFGSSDHRTSDEPIDLTVALHQEVQTEPLPTQGLPIMAEAVEGNDVCCQTFFKAKDQREEYRCWRCEQLEEARRRSMVRKEKVESELAILKEKIRVNEQKIREYEVAEQKLKVARELETKLESNFYVSSFKEIIRSYEEESAQIVTFIEKSFGIKKTSKQKSLKQLVEQVVSDLLANSQEVDRELRLINAIINSKKEVVEEREWTGPNHFATLRVIMEIKEKAVELVRADG